MAPLTTAALTTPTLPSGITSRFVAGINGLTMHILEAGAGAGRPLVILLHGFPELAYSWRKVMLPLAAAATRFPRAEASASVSRTRLKRRKAATSPS